MPVVTDGGRGVGVEAYGSNYPLVDPSPDVAGLLADFYLAHAVRAARPPLRLHWLHGFCNAQSSCGSASRSSGGPDPAHEADVVVKDAAGLTVFDSTVAAGFRAGPWGDRFRLYEWTGAGAVCRALVHAGAGEAAAVRAYETDLYPAAAVLDERASELVPGRVTTLSANGQAMTGVVALAAGYNTTLTEAAPGGPARTRRARARVVVAVAPGAGLGRYPGCQEPETVVRRVNGVGPDDRGDFGLAAAACYWLERPAVVTGTAAVTPAALRLHNDCGPCCECRDYENTYQGVRRLHARFKAAGARADALRGAFRANADRWRAERACRKASPTRVSVAALGGGYLGVAASFCNADDDCKYEVDLKLAFTHSAGGAGDVVRWATTATRPTGGGAVPQEPYGAWPEWGYYWPAVGPGRAVRLTTRLLFPAGGPGGSVTVTATPYVAGVARTAAAATAALGE